MRWHSDPGLSPGATGAWLSGRLVVRLLPVWVAGAAWAGDAVPGAIPPDPALVELTRPASTIELGASVFDRSAGSRGNPDRPDQTGGQPAVKFDLRGKQHSYGNDDDDKLRWRLVGAVPGLHSRSLAGEYGRQGSYRLTLNYDESQRLSTDSYQTPFLGVGTTSLMLPGGFVRGPDTASMPSLTNALRQVDLQTTRRRSEFGWSYWLTSDWELKLSMRNDKRDGTQLRGTVFGSNGGNARAMLLPEPVDASTHLLDASVAYSADDYRFQFAYHGSVFRNQVTALTWQNPYSSAPWVGGTTGLPTNVALLLGQVGVAPDNQFHQFSGSGSYDISNSTHLTLTASRGRMTQDDAFLPYTVKPGLTSSGLPRASLRGLVDTSFFNARLSMRPARNLSLSAALRFDSRVNQTPQDEYIYVGGDVQLQPQPDSNTDRIRTNLPRSRRQTLLALTADYRLPQGFALKAGWDHDRVKRTYSEVEQSTENTFRFELRHAGESPWSANASYARMARRGTDYQHNASYLASYSSSAFIAAAAAATNCVVLVECVRTGPLQSKFYLADRDRDRARLALDYAPGMAWSLQTRLDLNQDRFPHSPYGVAGATSWSAGADLSYAASENFHTTLFYSLDNQRTRERARQIASPNPAVATSSASDWENQFSDRTASVGFGAAITGLLGGRLTFSADAISVRGRSTITTTVGPAVSPPQNPAGPFPDLSLRSDELRLGARYAMDRHSAIQLRYLYRRVDSADWAYEQVGATTLTNLIGTNQAPARYSLHAVGISYLLTFR